MACRLQISLKIASTSNTSATKSAYERDRAQPGNAERVNHDMHEPRPEIQRTGKSGDCGRDAECLRHQNQWRKDD
jgi:hypothetical protein